MNSTEIRERINKGYYNLSTYKNTFPRQQIELEREFAYDIAVAYNIADNPKAVKAFDSAWEEKQSCGFNEVMDRFVELISQ